MSLAALSPPSRMLPLDVLRGLAILLVVFAHAVVPPAAAGSLAPLLTYLQRLGPSGVDLFFVLSGFLVGGLLFQELITTGHIDVRRFLIRRGFKIWPSYFAFIGVVFAGLVLVSRVPVAESVRALLPNLLHVQNYFGSPREHTWSLAVEEHFYLALPFLLVLLTAGARAKRGVIPALPVIAAGLLVVCALLRLHAALTSQAYNPLFATHLRIDSLFFGVLLAYLHHYRPERLAFVARHPMALAALGTALLLGYPALLRWDHNNVIASPIGATMLAAGYGCLLVAAVRGTPGSWLGRRLRGATARGVAFIGVFSYPIYLWHVDAARLVAWCLRLEPVAQLPPELRWISAFVLYVAFAAACGVFFGLLLERPSLALRDRLFPSRAGPPL